MILIECNTQTSKYSDIVSWESDVHVFITLLRQPEVQNLKSANQIAPLPVQYF